MKKQKEGFTLFELLVSISIIGILVALSSLSFSAAQKKARDARRMEDMKTVQSAAEQYFAIANYVYPANTNAPSSWTYSGQVVLDRFPADPKGTGWTGYAASSIGATGYCICAAVENSANGNSTGVTCNIGSSGPYYCVKNQQ